MNIFMKEAIDEAMQGVLEGHGGPFGAVIVRNNQIIAKAHNSVVHCNDPTAHAEMLAIRQAAKKLGRFELSDCILYTSCEPCPMCFAAACWAHIPTIYYGANRYDAQGIGFDDKFIYDILQATPSVASKDIPPEKKQSPCLHEIHRDEALIAFERWATKEDKTLY